MSFRNQFRRRPRPASWLAVFVVLTASSACCAELPRIQGAYAVINATQSGTEIHVTLELYLFNPTAADMVAARIGLRDSFLFEDYGAFAPVSIKAGQRITLRGDFNIPKREYDLWQRGRPPNFLLEFGDTFESEVGQKVALLPRRTGRRSPTLNKKTPEPAFAGERLRVTSPSSTSSHRLVNPASTLNGMTGSASSQDLISTIAGAGPHNIPALNAGLGQASNAVPDDFGNLYIADFDESRIYKMDSKGVLTTVAGNGFAWYGGDGGLAFAAELLNPYAVTVDSVGNIFIADTGNLAIRKLDSSGVITTVAELGNCRAAPCGFPTGIITDSSGNLFVSLAGFSNRGPLNHIIEIDSSGNISNVAGSGVAGYSGDGGPAISAELNSPSSMALDSSGNMFIADFYNDRVRKVDTTGIISTVAGNGTAGYSGDGGPATSAELHNPSGVLLDNSGNLLIADWGNNRIRKVNASGIISTVAGKGSAGYSGDGGPAISAELNAPFGLHSDSSGNLFIGDMHNFVIRKVNTAGVISTVAGNGSYAFLEEGIENPWVGSFGGDGNAAVDAQLSGVGGVAVDGAGNIFVADSGNNRIRKIDGTGKITTVAGGGSGTDGGPANDALISNPAGLALDSGGNLFIAEYGNSRIRKVDTNGMISTVAGSNSELAGPTSVAVDTAGNLFIADLGSNRIFKLDASGTLTVVAGNGAAGYSGDGGPATSAELNSPAGVAVDGAGNLFIADYWNAVVRKVDPSGRITTFAGDGSITQCGGTSPIVGDGGPATSAALCSPIGLALDENGDVFISDHDEQVIRKVDPTGIISTVAGKPNYCFCIDFSGDSGPATDAVLDSPTGIAVNSSGDIVYIPDQGDNRVREVYSPSAGFILSVTENGNGSGTGLSLPDGINCTVTCSGNFPAGMTVTLNAYPAVGSSFAGWSVCPGLGACSVTMNANQSVTATFNLGPPPDFSVKAASASFTLQPGGQTTDVITVASQNGPFASLVQLSCVVTGSLPLPTCSLSTTSVTPGSNSATSTLTINAPAQSAHVAPFVAYATLAPLALALMAFGFGSATSKERKHRMSFLCSILIASVAFQVGCGGGSTTQQKQPQNYAVTITGDSGALSHTAQVTVTVQ